MTTVDDGEGRTLQYMVIDRDKSSLGFEVSIFSMVLPWLGLIIMKFMHFKTGVLEENLRQKLNLIT